jgi:hypothetical protein
MSGSNRNMSASFDYTEHMDPDTSITEDYNRDEATIIELHPDRQKATSFRIRMEDVGTGEANVASAGYSLTGLNLNVGIKQAPYGSRNNRKASKE